MRRARALLSQLVGAVRARGVDDFDDELAAHLELHVEDNIRAGMTLDEARRNALLRLGGPASRCPAAGPCTPDSPVSLASYLPARRAARVDPMVALRSE